MSQPVARGGASRTWNGVQFPSAGTWVLDPTHTTVEFEARHLMVAKVKGRFGQFEGALHIADEIDTVNRMFRRRDRKLKRQGIRK